MRLSLNDGTRAITLKLCDALPGPMDVVLRTLASPEGLVVVYGLDELGIYGSDIWVAYKDVCGQDLAKLAIAVRLTLEGECDLKAAAIEQQAFPVSRVATKRVQALIGVKGTPGKEP